MNDGREVLFPGPFTGFGNTWTGLFRTEYRDLHGDTLPYWEQAAAETPKRQGSWRDKGV
jgi:hypothetical protein